MRGGFCQPAVGQQDRKVKVKVVVDVTEGEWRDGREREMCQKRQ